MQLPVIHRPAPRYPPGYNHEIGYIPLVGGYTTPDLSATDTTPAPTDSQSELLHSPAFEGFFTYIPGPLRHENTFQKVQPLPEPHAPFFSTGERFPNSPVKYESSFALTVFSPVNPSEDESTLRGVQETQTWAPGYCQPSSIHVSEHPASVTHVVPLKFSRESYNVLLQTRGPIPLEIKNPSDRNPYSFVVLDRRGCHPVISISETYGELSDITIDFNGIIVVLTKDNFCRIPGCGYWSKNAGRVPRHRLTHFTDRGFECQNPYYRGADVPKQMRCQLGPRQYLTRLDLFKKHFRAPNCQRYAPSFTQDSQTNFWRGPENVDELYLLPFTRDVHIPYVLRTHQS